jgi:hypothetical protein
MVTGIYISAVGNFCSSVRFVDDIFCRCTCTHFVSLEGRPATRFFCIILSAIKEASYAVSLAPVCHINMSMYDALWGSGLEYVLHIPLCVVRGDWMGTCEDSCWSIFSTSPCVCRKRRLNGAVLRMRPEKTRSHVRCGMIKIPPYSKVLSYGIGLNFAALHR